MSHAGADTSLRGLLECLLLVHAEPLRLGEVAEVFGLEKAEVEAAMEALAAHYAGDLQRGIQITPVAGGWRMTTRPAYGEDIRRFYKAKPQPLSGAALETLAIVAYKQPVMRSEIESVRGVDCGGTLRNLLDRGLIRIHGKKDLPGRPLVYTTSRRFLEVFNLTALSQLPSLKDLGEIEGGPDSLELFPGEALNGATPVQAVDQEEPQEGEDAGGGFNDPNNDPPPPHHEDESAPAEPAVRFPARKGQDFEEAG